jgi:isopentenyl-diphosphate delta-isomerase
VVRSLEVPVVAKEVGSGLSERVARALAAQGVRILDTAGTGGTSWARIEAQRSGELDLGELFAGWGLPTPLSIQEVRRVDGVTVIASGGLRNGMDVAKALALGADLAGMAYPFLRPATESPERVAGQVARIVRELKICMFCLGVKTVAELRTVELRKGS